MEGESKTPVASASDAGGQSAAGARRADAGASIAGCGSLSALPAEEAVVSSADLVQWSGQVEIEASLLVLLMAYVLELYIYIIISVITGGLVGP